MILVDTNVWLALAIERHAYHRACLDWLDTQVVPNGLYFCRATQQSFLRLLTNGSLQKVYKLGTLGNSEAWEIYSLFLADDRIAFRAQEPPQLELRWKTLSSGTKASTKLWMDAYLASFALASGDQLVTIDRDFLQFPGLALHLLEK